jgi:hypothetical protein
MSSAAAVVDSVAEDTLPDTSEKSVSQKKKKNQPKKKKALSKKQKLLKEAQPKKKKQKVVVNKESKPVSGVFRRIIIPTDAKPYTVTWQKSEDTLKLLQEAVAGRIERYPMPGNNKHKLDLYVNEEGLLQKLPLNTNLLDRLGIRVSGAAVLACANKKGDDADIPEECTEATWHKYLI